MHISLVWDWPDVNETKSPIPLESWNEETSLLVKKLFFEFYSHKKELIDVKMSHHNINLNYESSILYKRRIS